MTLGEGLQGVDPDRIDRWVKTLQEILQETQLALQQTNTTLVTLTARLPAPPVPVDDAFNLSIRAETPIAKNPASWNSPQSKTSASSTITHQIDAQSSSSALTVSTPVGNSTVEHEKSIATTAGNSITTTSNPKSVNPNAHPLVGKRFKCNLPCHRSSDCRGAGERVNLAIREGDGGELEFGKEDVGYEEEHEIEFYYLESETAICHPEGSDMGVKPGSTSLIQGLGFQTSLVTYQVQISALCSQSELVTCVVQNGLLSQKLTDNPIQLRNLFRTRCIAHIDCEEENKGKFVTYPNCLLLFPPLRDKNDLLYPMKNSRTSLIQAGENDGDKTENDGDKTGVG